MYPGNGSMVGLELHRVCGFNTTTVFTKKIMVLFSELLAYFGINK